MDRRTLTMADYDRLGQLDRHAIDAWIRTCQLDGVTRVRLLDDTGRRIEVTRYMRDDTGSRYLAAQGTPAETTETITVPVPFPTHLLDLVHAA